MPTCRKTWNAINSPTTSHLNTHIRFTISPIDRPYFSSKTPIQQPHLAVTKPSERVKRLANSYQPVSPLV